MRYLVDLEKKEIVYDEDMPAGHMIALRKVFKDKGFEFVPKKSIETMDEFNEKMHAEISRHAVSWKSGPSGPVTGPVGSAGTPGPIGLSITDVVRYEKARLKQREHEERDRWMQQMIGGQRLKYYSPDGREHGSKEEMESYMRTNQYPFHPEEAHPADKSNAELRYEASKIQEELEDVQKTSRLKESLEKLKSKLGFL